MKRQYFFISIIVVLFLLFSARVHASTLHITSQGTLKPSFVLGDSIKKDEEEQKDTDENEKQDDKNQKDEKENEKEKDKEKEKEHEDKIKKEKSDKDASEEGKLHDEEKEHEKNDTDKLHLEIDGDKIHYEHEQHGEKKEASESSKIDIEEHEDKRKIKIEAQDNKFYIIKNKTAARTLFPLSVDLKTNELIVTTSSGERRVAVLPDQAIQAILAANVLDDISHDRKVQDTQQASDSGVLLPSLTDRVVEMEETDDGVLVYKVHGKRIKKIFGVYSVSIDKSVLVSAETGEIVKVQQSFFSRLLEGVSV